MRSAIVGTWSSQSPWRFGASYVAAVARAAKQSRNGARIYTGFDQENHWDKKPADTLRFLTRNVPTRNRVYGAGISTCFGIGSYKKEMVTGAKNIANGSLAFSYSWSFKGARPHLRHQALSDRPARRAAGAGVFGTGAPGMGGSGRGT
jgi:hypothetical protein